jgi:hypothetical protein
LDYRYSDDLVREVVKEVGFNVIDSLVLPGRPARSQPIPESLVDPIRAHIARILPKALYIHQVEAITSALDGADVCLAASTASGKSMVFMTVAPQLLPQREWIRLGAELGCCGLLVHSFFDSNLHIPANAAWFAVLAGLACSAPETQRGIAITNE